ncbi:hypothetical protein GOP47_0003829 [Adiantum capillus-veneris]|uniref:Transcription factor MYC/MYB N-terminal domain-containing protein n=1 Tax=Adiantum capillus-veneris TaxID=13818 RepID=A0A9D4V7E9_ADICA|nr:hypothetical protein GOP47_0003829 [Adiantum capillus-veneris]
MRRASSCGGSKTDVSSRSLEGEMNMQGVERSKEAAAMLALHDALRNVCLNYEWTYSVFWTIRPRPRCRGGSTCKVGEDNGSLMLMWEDGYCHLDQRPSQPNTIVMQQRTKDHQQHMHMNANTTMHNLGMTNGLVSSNGPIHDHQYLCHHEQLNNVADGEDPVWKAFRKMSIQLYNYGEGLMGKVASDKCHKWVFKESPESEAGISSYWQSSFDAHPPEWIDQFAAGIQTIAVIQAGQGLLQLGSCKVISEDLHFVLRMRHAFESLEYPSSIFLPPGFAGNNNNNIMMRGNVHVGAAASMLSNMYTNALGLAPPPPSPHSWSLCTNGQLQAAETRALRSATGALLLKQSPGDGGNSSSVNVAACSDNDMMNTMQSPRLTLNPSTCMMMSPRGADQRRELNSPLSLHHHVVASTPSSSKLYQRRFSSSSLNNLMPPVGAAAAKLGMHHTSGLSFLSNVGNSPPASISSLEALLSQRSPLHAVASCRKSSQ